MSYKNKSNNKFESYNNGERSHMVSPDALSALGDSHRKFDAAMEKGKRAGVAIREGIDKYEAKKREEEEGSDLDVNGNIITDAD